MLIAIDCETEGLDCTKFIMGCIVKQGHKKAEVFHNKNDLWNRVIELGIKQAKKGKVLNVYSHHAQFDTACYVDVTDRNMVFFCNKPFIWAYKLDRDKCVELGIKIDMNKKYKEIIKFLDTMSIFNMSLKRVGDMIGIKKMDMPKELLQEQISGKLDSLKLKEIEKYMINDALICLKSVEYIRKKITDKGVRIKRLYTISQIAIGYLINRFKQINNNEHIFEDIKTGKFYETRNKELIHKAYRGGRVEAFQTGIFEKGINNLDVNGLYCKASEIIDFPDLRTEKYIKEPLKSNKKEDILNKIGVSRAIVRNNSCKLGFLPKRTDIGNYYPKIGKILIGTWTNKELKYAEEIGYEILDMEYSIVYDKGFNPFTIITPELYKSKIESETALEVYFYKMMMVASYGKLAQVRTNQEIIIDSVEKATEYLNRNFEILKGINYDYMYINKEKETNYKQYYCPIIPAYINAEGRIYMYKEFIKIKEEDLIYTDTDSIVFKGNYLNKFEIGNELGQFKVLNQDTSCVIYGRKTYVIADSIKVSGFSKRDISKQQFIDGEIESKSMITIKTMKKPEDLGKFEKRKRNLKDQKTSHDKMMIRLNKQEVLVDKDLNDISYFIKCLNDVIQD